MENLGETGFQRGTGNFQKNLVIEIISRSSTCVAQKHDLDFMFLYKIMYRMQHLNPKLKQILLMYLSKAVERII